jgi:hypothetical protein
MLERAAQQRRLFDIARRHQSGGVAALVQADGKTSVAQGFEKPGELGRDQPGNLVDLRISGRGAATAHATFPNNLAVTSGLKRARSSWVLSRHIKVS